LFNFLYRDFRKFDPSVFILLAMVVSSDIPVPSVVKKYESVIPGASVVKKIQKWSQLLPLNTSLQKKRNALFLTLFSKDTTMNETESLELMKPSLEDSENFSSIQGEAMSAPENNPEITAETHDASHQESHAENEASEVMSPEQSAYLDGLMRDLAALPDAENKLQRVIAFMEEALSQTGRPHFKSFWQARGLCIQFFKDDSISPTIRTNLWAKYTELSKTARRLKEFFDEQSAFAVEQIEIAINALETEVTQLEQQQGEIPQHEIAIESKTLEGHYPFYIKIQGEIDLLNTKAARINALRKELINTGMPSRKKNKFFQRLSLLGDKVFPRRKELIQKLSEHFIKDIDAFIKTYFSGSDLHGPLFFLREEIKSLQGIAKSLTLNTQAFTHTRMCLSECWDKIKQLDKERKKTRIQQKNIFKENEDAVKAKIEECRLALAENKLSPNDGLKKIDEVVNFMRTVQLGRMELKSLRDELDALRQPLFDQMKAADQRRHDQESERQNQKERSNQELKTAIESLLNNASGMTIDLLNSERDQLIQRIQTPQFSRTEKLEFERILKPLRDIILEKKSQALQNLSDNDRQALVQLKDLLNERKELRQEVKEQLEALRRAVGSSGLDFEKALEYNAQLSAQKERLEKINHGIQEVEQRISELEKI
jgi:hypothetical protein